MSNEHTEPDYSNPRLWLRDEGYSRDDLVTPEQMHAAARQLEQRGRELLSISEDVISELDRADNCLAKARAGL